MNDRDKRIRRRRWNRVIDYAILCYFLFVLMLCVHALAGAMR